LSIPNTFARPEVGCAQESSILTNVVFPAPFGPSSPNIVPRSTLKETSCTARNSCLLQRRRKVFDKPSVSMAASISGYHFLRTEKAPSSFSLWQTGHSKRMSDVRFRMSEGRLLYVRTVSTTTEIRHPKSEIQVSL